MAGSSDSSESSSDPTTVAAGLLIMALLWWGFVRGVTAVRNAICRRFCPSWAPKPAVQTVKAGDIVMGADGDLVKDVTVAPRLQKNLTVAYWLWQCLGLVGAHHFYLGRISQGLVWAFSLGMFGFGWLIDGAFLKKYTEWANKDVPANRPYDAYCGRIAVKSILLLLVAGALGSGIFFQGPTALKFVGVIDIPDDPHDILGLSYGFSKADLKKAYKKEAMRWHPDKNPQCGKKCDDQTSKINEAYRLLKDPAMFSDQRANEWMVVWETFQKWMEKSSSKGADDEGGDAGDTKKKKKKKRKKKHSDDDEL